MCADRKQSWAFRARDSESKSESESERERERERERDQVTPRSLKDQRSQ